MNILDKIFGSTLGAIDGIIGKFVTDPTKKLEAQMAARALTTEMQKDVLGFVEAEIEARSKIIVAETQSNWYVASWRPTLMYCFILIFLYSIPAAVFGWPAVDFSGIPDKAWTMLTLGISGYIGARTIDKTLVPALAAWKKKEEV